MSFLHGCPACGFWVFFEFLEWYNNNNNNKNKNNNNNNNNNCMGDHKCCRL